MMNDEDQRPVIGKCDWCGCDIHKGDATHYSDEYYEFDGTLICEDCVNSYINRYYKKGGC